MMLISLAKSGSRGSAPQFRQDSQLWQKVCGIRHSACHGRWRARFFHSFSESGFLGRTYIFEEGSAWCEGVAGWRSTDSSLLRFLRVSVFLVAWVTHVSLHLCLGTINVPYGRGRLWFPSTDE